MHVHVHVQGRAGRDIGPSGWVLGLVLVSLCVGAYVGWWVRAGDRWLVARV